MSNIRMTQKIAQLSFWDAIGADDLVASEIMQSPLEYAESAPFDRIETDSYLDSLLWSKTFHQESSIVAPSPVVRTYLSVLMPELYQFSTSPSMIYAVWTTENPGRVLSEAFDSMSPTTKEILDGSTTFKEVIENFFTPEVAAKAHALNDAPQRHMKREIVRILMSGEAVSLAEGIL